MRNLEDFPLLVSILSTGFPMDVAEHLAREILDEVQTDDEAFALAGAHLKAGGDDNRLRRQFAARHREYVASTCERAGKRELAEGILKRAWKAYKRDPSKGEQAYVAWGTVDVVVGCE